MNAIGLIEVIGYVAAIEAGDACVKAANVNIVTLDKVGAGIVTITVTGDVGTVKSAIEAAEISASRVGTVRSTHIIPRINNDVANVLFKKEDEKTTEASVDVDENLLEEDNKTTEITILDISNIEETSNIDEIEDTNIYDEDLSKYSVKELKSLAKKLDNELTYKKLNALRKEELIDLVKELEGDEK